MLCTPGAFAANSQAVRALADYFGIKERAAYNLMQQVRAVNSPNGEEGTL
jgi:hypothetical protein